MFCTVFVLLLIRQFSQSCNEGNIKCAVRSTTQQQQLFNRLVYYQSTLSLLTVQKAEWKRQIAVIGLLFSLKAERGHGNIYWVPAPPPLPCRSHPARLAFMPHSQGMCFAPVWDFSASPSFPSSASPPCTLCTGTPTSSLKNQQPLMLDEGERSWMREKEGGVFPLIDS